MVGKKVKHRDYELSDSYENFSLNNESIKNLQQSKITSPFPRQNLPKNIVSPKETYYEYALGY